MFSYDSGVTKAKNTSKTLANQYSISKRLYIFFQKILFMNYLIKLRSSSYDWGFGMKDYKK